MDIRKVDFYIPALTATNNDNPISGATEPVKFIIIPKNFLSRPGSNRSWHRGPIISLSSLSINYQIDQSREHVTDATTSRKSIASICISGAIRKGFSKSNGYHNLLPTSLASALLLDNYTNSLKQLPWRPISSTIKPAQRQQPARRRNRLEKRMRMRDCSLGSRNSTCHESLLDRFMLKLLRV